MFYLFSYRSLLFDDISYDLFYQNIFNYFRFLLSLLMLLSFSTFFTFSFYATSDFSFFYYFILSYFISPYFFSSNFISSYFISSYLSHLISPHLVSFHLSSWYLIISSLSFLIFSCHFFSSLFKLRCQVLKKDYIIKKNQVEHTRTERSVLGYVHHPFIVGLTMAFQVFYDLLRIIIYIAIVIL